MFLDRDGVIIDDVHYLSRLEQIHLIPGAGSAIRRLNEAGIPVVVVTNQSAVAQGIIEESFVANAHALLEELLQRENARIDRFYYCPHHAEKGRDPYRVDCSCRKPAPGMLLAAAQDMGLDLSRSWIIGDKLSDLEAGAAVGCRTILVRTGHGMEVKLPANSASLNLQGTVPTIGEAVELFTKRNSQPNAA